jgi:hypothetical protein
MKITHLGKKWQNVKRTLSGDDSFCKTMQLIFLKILQWQEALIYFHGHETMLLTVQNKCAQKYQKLNIFFCSLAAKKFSPSRPGSTKQSQLQPRRESFFSMGQCHEVLISGFFMNHFRQSP